MQIPPVPSILCQPFEWIPIPSGRVILDENSFPTKDRQNVFDIPSFFIAKYPITNGQYAVFKKRDFVTTDDDHPATNVSWQDAIEYCTWLSEQTGLSISLPTEQQWQRATIGDTGWLYPWGNEFDKNLCNTIESGLGTTTPVTQYPGGVSPYGVMDTCGNVAEATLNDWFTGDTTIPEYYSNRPRVWRGGSWNHNALKSTAIFRGASMPPDGVSFFGFRIVAIYYS